MYVGRILLAEGVGHVAFANNVVSYFILFATLGLSSYGTREVAKVQNDQNKKNVLFTELFVVNSICTTISLLCFAIFILVVHKTSGDFILYVCCGIPLLFNYANIDWVYRGQEEYGYIVCRSLVVKVLMIVALFVFVHKSEDYVIYALIASLATSGNYLFNIFHVRKYVHFDFSCLNLFRHWKSILIIFAGDIVASIYMKLDILMLGLMSDSAYVGYYDYAQKTVVVIITICVSFSDAFLPRLSSYYESAREKFLELVNIGLKLLIFLTIPFGAGAVLLAPCLIEILYGDNFLPSILTLRIFSSLIVIRGIGDLICWKVLVSIGCERIRVPILLSSGVLNILLNFILIPVWKHNGAAFASVVSEFFVTVSIFIYVLKRIHFLFPVKLFFQTVLTTVIMGIAIALCLNFVSSVFFGLLVSFVGGCSVYFTLNLIIHNEILFFGIEKFLCRSRK